MSRGSLTFAPAGVQGCLALDEVATVATETTRSVICAPAGPDVYAIRFHRARPKVEDGVIAECPFGVCPTEDDRDLYVCPSSQTDPHSVIRQNRTTGVEIAHWPGVTDGRLRSVTDARST